MRGVEMGWGVTGGVVCVCPSLCSCPVLRTNRELAISLMLAGAGMTLSEEEDDEAEHYR